VISSSPSATRILHRIAANPAAPLTAVVVGPGGTGKSVVLDALASAYAGTGVELVRSSGRGAGLHERLEPGKAVLVDDAHRLDPAALERLRTFARHDDARLIVAYRPWPVSRPLSTLGAHGTRRGVTVVVGHLDRAAVATRVEQRLSCAPPDSLVDLVHEQSGGLPALVEVVTAALVESGRFQVGQPEAFRRPKGFTISMPMAQRLRHLVDVLEPEVHTLLDAMAVGATLETEVLSQLLSAQPEELARTTETARATGLLTESGELIPFVRTLLLRLAPVLEIRELQRRLAAIQLDRGGSVLQAGRLMLGTGAGGSRNATIFETAGDEALPSSPALAAELFAAAVEAGAVPARVAARRACAVALAGDLGAALRFADHAIADPNAPDRERAVAVASAALTHRGLLTHSADLIRKLPGDRPAAAVLAVPALVGVGATAEARAVLDAAEADRGAATLLDGAATMMARGMLTTITGAASPALSQLAGAARMLEPVAPSVLLPDTPEALTALVALHSGEFALAHASIRRAADGRHGGKPARARHVLLHGWEAMLRGRFETARRAVAAAQGANGLLEARDELFAAALEVALARREGDAAGLLTAWHRTRIALVHHPVDLYTLLPLGELAVAAAELREREWIATQLDDAWRLLAGLGSPGVWAVPLHWAELQAAVTSGQQPEAEHHAQALAEAASTGPYARALGAAAASWVQVEWEVIDAEGVQAAAARLHALGLRWEGARLAGRAAVRAEDRRAVTTLLACARRLFPSAAAGEPELSGSELSGSELSGSELSGAEPAEVEPVAEAEADGRARSADSRGDAVDGADVLTERDLAIGQLILDGLTYKQIGQQLFLSAKTVEHYVARIRQRLGVASRNDLFSRLRELLGATS